MYRTSAFLFNALQSIEFKCSREDRNLAFFGSNKNLIIRRTKLLTICSIFLGANDTPLSILGSTCATLCASENLKKSSALSPCQEAGDSCHYSKQDSIDDTNR